MGIVLFIIGFLAFIGTMIFFAIADDYDSIVFVILTIVCAVIFVAVCAYGIKLGLEYEKAQKDKKYEICSLTTKSTITDGSKGIFVLGIGVYQKKEKENIYYYFYKKERQGG